MENDSNCQTMLLQIDAWLDRELSPDQEQALLAHSRQCAACGAELQYAMTLHQQVTQLPLMDCPSLAMTPLERLKNEARTPAAGFNARRLRLPGFPSFNLPGFRPAMAGALVMALAFGFALGRMGEPSPAPAQLAQDETAQGSESYTQEEIISAIEDMEVAISTLQEVTARTGSLVERQLLEQVRIQINASSPENEAPANGNGPI